MTENNKINKIKPLVSICCIAYNQEKYIWQALDGFLMQKTNFSFEVIVHDDASTDGTADIIREYQRKHPEIIKPIFQKENQFSKGIKISTTYVWPLAKGKYLALCEGDDYWTDPLKLQKQVGFLEANEDFSLCFTKVGTYRNDKIDDEEHKKYYYKIMGDRTDFTTEDILKDNFIATCSVVFRKINLLNYPDWSSQLPFGDWLLNFVNSMHGKIKYIDELMAVYRIHEGSIWSTKPIAEKQKGRFDFYFLISKHLGNKYDEIIIQSISETAMEYVKYSSELVEAKEYLEKQNKNKDKIISELTSHL